MVTLLDKQTAISDYKRFRQDPKMSAVAGYLRVLIVRHLSPLENEIFSLMCNEKRPLTNAMIADQLAKSRRSTAVVVKRLVDYGLLHKRKSFGEQYWYEWQY